MPESAGWDRFELSGRQSLAYQTLRDPEVDELLYGGAKGGGKSVFGCFWAHDFCVELIKKYQLKPRKFPLPVGFMGRKQSIDFSNTTLETWKKFIPPDQYRIKEHDHEIIIGEAVKIDYGGFDRVESLNKFNSAEYAFFFLDQAEEISKDEVAMLRGCSHYRLIIKGHKQPGKGLLTANPAPCWLKPDFILFPQKNHRFVQALPSDNKWTGAEYVKALEDAFRHRPDLLKAYRDGDWDAFEGDDQLITAESIRKAIVSVTPVYTGWLIVCDVARFGDDDTVIQVLNGTNIERKINWGKSRTTKISGQMLELSRQHEDCPCVVDEIGVGGGVIDELHDYGREVISFNSSLKAKKSTKYYNLRSECWWVAAEMFAVGDVHCPGMYSALQQQLTIPRYDFRRGRMLVESKEDIKKRLGHSPDDADCYVMGLWAQDLISQGQSFTAKDAQILYDKYAPPVASF